MTWWAPDSVVWVKTAPSPPAWVESPRAASVMRAYWRSRRGKLITGSEHRMDWSSRKAARAGAGSGTFAVNPESLRVRAVSGADIWAKLRTWVRKKLQSPRNWRTSLTELGGGASCTALSLSVPGRIPSSDNKNPRYWTWLLPKTHFCSLTFRLCAIRRVKSWSSVFKWMSWSDECTIRSSM